MHIQTGKLLIRLVLAFLIIIVIVVAFLSWLEQRILNAPKQNTTFAVEVVKKGENLLQMADCSSCHTADNGAYLAGGVPLETPFGTLYGSNITSSADFGIGRWTSDDFYKAITTGVAPPSKHLYPAMPYQYFNNIAREDSDAIYAYLMSTQPIDVAPKPNELNFPFNNRLLLIGWNLLFLDKEELPSASKGSSPEWERGQYIVNALGHCAMCHTPIGDFGQAEKNKMFQGGELGRFSAPNITPQGLAYRGWTKEDLKQYLATGLSKQGSAFSDMYRVINLSTQHLDDNEINAIATYLIGDVQLPPREVKNTPIEPSNAYDLYLNMCAGCHNADGSGKPNVAIAMINNSTVMNKDSTNLIVSILDGLPWQTFPNEQRLQSMPSFADKMSDEEIASLANFIRTQWGGLTTNITAQDVKKLRNEK